MAALWTNNNGVSVIDFFDQEKLNFYISLRKEGLSNGKTIKDYPVRVVFESEKVSYILSYTIYDNIVVVKQDVLSVVGLIKENRNKKCFIFLGNNGENGYHKEELFLRASVFYNLIDFSLSDRMIGYSNVPFSKPSNFSVFTHVYNEDFFLRKFLQYYSQFVDAKDIFVIDHGSDSVDIASICRFWGVQVIKIPKDKVDHVNILRYVEYFQRFLLTNYKFVLHVDCDELIVHKKGMNYFINSLEYCDKPTVFKPSVGCNIVQHPYEELDIVDLDFSITDQRKYYYNDVVNYTKPVLANTPVNWSMGFHDQMNKQHQVVEDSLWLIHLGSVSVSESLNKTNNWIKNEKSDLDKSYVKHDYRSSSVIDIRNNLNKLFEESNKIELLPEWILGMF